MTLNIGWYEAIGLIAALLAPRETAALMLLYIAYWLAQHGDQFVAMALVR